MSQALSGRLGESNKEYKEKPPLGTGRSWQPVKLRREADSDYSGHISHKLGDSTWCVEESSACLKVRTQANSTRNPYAQVAELARTDLLAVEESVPGRAGSSLQSKNTEARSTEAYASAARPYCSLDFRHIPIAQRDTVCSTP